MWDRLVLVLEILCMIQCVHCVHEKRAGFDIRAVILFANLLAILEAINFFHLNGMLSFAIHIPVFIYCKLVFQESVKKTVYNLLLFIIIMAALQFTAMFLIGIFVRENIVLRNVLGNFAVLLICIWILPVVPVSKLKGLYKGSVFNKILFGMVLAVVFVMMFQGKYLRTIHTEFFVFAVPAAAVLLVMLGRWNILQAKVGELEGMDVAGGLKKEYSDLLASVRLRQHEFKNHLAAILGAHYTYTDYEKLVKMQEEYCGKIIQENKYNSLLCLGDGVLAGFLYRKFQEIEKDGIAVEYQIKDGIGENCAVPVYYLIEMLGILLDNAAEAVKDMPGRKIIHFSAGGKEAGYVFSVRNKSVHKPYAEIESWFGLGASSKGMGRGLGLPHVKSLCKEWKCDICCRNVEIGQDNWIEFVLDVP